MRKRLYLEGLPSRGRLRARFRGRGRPEWSRAWTIRWVAWCSRLRRLLVRLALRRFPRRKYDIAQHFGRAVGGQGEQVARARASGRRGHWSACPCRAIQRLSAWTSASSDVKRIAGQTGADVASSGMTWASADAARVVTASHSGGEGQGASTSISSSNPTSVTPAKAGVPLFFCDVSTKSTLAERRAAAKAAGPPLSRG
jgi:hypothetical protein